MPSGSQGVAVAVADPREEAADGGDRGQRRRRRAADRRPPAARTTSTAAGITRSRPVGRVSVARAPSSAAHHHRPPAQRQQLAGGQRQERPLGVGPHRAERRRGDADERGRPPGEVGVAGLARRTSRWTTRRRPTRPPRLASSEHADAGLAEQREQRVEADAAGLDGVVPADGDVAVVGAVPGEQALRRRAPAGRRRGATRPAARVDAPRHAARAPARPPTPAARPAGRRASRRRSLVRRRQPNTTRAACSKKSSPRSSATTANGPRRSTCALSERLAVALEGPVRAVPRHPDAAVGGDALVDRRRRRRRGRRRRCAPRSRTSRPAGRRRGSGTPAPASPRSPSWSSARRIAGPSWSGQTTTASSAPALGGDDARPARPPGCGRRGRCR